MISAPGDQPDESDNFTAKQFRRMSVHHVLQKHRDLLSLSTATISWSIQLLSVCFCSTQKEVCQRKEDFLTSEKKDL